MAQVRMVARISGSRDGVDWPAPGEILDCSDEEAAELIGNALAVDPGAEEEHATGDDSDVETATPKRRSRRAANG